MSTDGLVCFYKSIQVCPAVEYACPVGTVLPNRINPVSRFENHFSDAVLMTLTVIAPDLDKINLIKELLCVQFHKGQISLFSESDVDFMIWFLCTS